MIEAATRATVLLVDDEEDLREAMRRMLERRGFATLQAAGPDQAVSLAASHAGRIDLLLTDLGLAGRSGGDLARSVTGLSPQTRILFVSGLPREVAVDKGLVGVDARLLEKPFTSQALVAAVAESLAG
ncbi:response regulator [Rhizomonospora bruguierae]|uniref:response regulator n=1 Tax=Rhizomonospora bruguierae TaxID=1581705 RepID=UPI001BCE8855|nr:response regulator [Micromonospora sp. NBRC 107566]